jgi:hypothetical protein
MPRYEDKLFIVTHTHADKDRFIVHKFPTDTHVTQKIHKFKSSIDQQSASVQISTEEAPLTVGQIP